MMRSGEVGNRQGNIQVGLLVESLKNYKRFRNMGCYNISCLLSHLKPPNALWRENVAAAVECGAIEAMVTLIRQHPDSVDILKQTALGLKCLCVNAENAARVADSGAIECALNVMKNLSEEVENDPDGAEAQAAECDLIVTLATQNPAALRNSKTAVTGLLDMLANATSQNVRATAAKVLDRIGVSPMDADMLVEIGAIEAILKGFQFENVNKDIIIPSLRFLSRAISNPIHVASLRQTGMATELVKILETHAHDEEILRLGGEVLAGLASDDLDNILNQLQSNTRLSRDTREYLTSLASNLALKSQNVEAIMSHGGLQQLLSSFNSISLDSKMATARMIERIAISEDNAKEIIRLGGIEVLVRSIRGNINNRAFVRDASAAIAKVAEASLETAKLVYMQGGISAMFEAMRHDLSNESNAVRTLDMIKNITKSGFDIPTLLQMDVVNLVLEVMKANYENGSVQLSGFQALLLMLKKDDVSANIQNTSTTASRVFDHPEGFEILLQSLCHHKSKLKIVSLALNLLSELLGRVKESARRLNKAGGMSVIGSAIFSIEFLYLSGKGKSHVTQNAKLHESIRFVVSAILPYSQHSMKQVVDSFAKKVEMASLSSDDILELEQLLKSVALFSMTPNLASDLHEANWSATLLEFFDKIIQNGSDSERASLLPKLIVAIWEFASASTACMHGLVQGDACLAMVNSLKKSRREIDPAVSLTRTMKLFASTSASRIQLVSLKAIELCVDLIRTNLEQPRVLDAALEFFVPFAVPESLADLFNRGAVKESIRIIRDSAASFAFEDTVERVLELLDRIVNARYELDFCRSALIKYGAIAAVAGAMEAFPFNEDIERLGSHVLSILIDPHEIQDLVEVIKRLLSELEKGSSADTIFPKLGQSIAILGCIALIEQKRDLLLELECPQLLRRSLAAIGRQKLSRFREVAICLAYRALGHFFQGGILNLEIDAVDLLVKPLKARPSGFSLKEKGAVLDAIAVIALDANLAFNLLRHGAGDAIIHLIQNNIHDTVLLTFGFDALGTLTVSESNAELCEKNGSAGIGCFVLKVYADGNVPRLCGHVIRTLVNLCAVNSLSSQILTDDTLDLLSTVLQCYFGDLHRYDSWLLAHVCNLLKLLFCAKPNFAFFDTNGVASKVLKVAHSSKDYLSIEAHCLNIMLLIESWCTDPGMSQVLILHNADQLVLSAMGLHPHSKSIAETASKIMSCLMHGKLSINELLGRIRTLVAKHSLDQSEYLTIFSLVSALDDLTDAVVMKPTFDFSTGMEIVDTIQNALNACNIVPSLGPIRDDFFASTLKILSQTACILRYDNIMETIVALILETGKKNADDIHIVQCVINSLGVIADVPEGMHAVAVGGGIDILASVLNKSENVNCMNSALNALQRISMTAAANPKLLAVDDAGIAALSAIILTCEYNPALQYEFLRTLVDQKDGTGVILSVLGHGVVTADSSSSTMAIVGALDEKFNDKSSLVFSDAKQIQGLLSVLDCIDHEMHLADQEAVLTSSATALRLLINSSQSSDRLFASARLGPQISRVLKASTDVIVVEHALAALVRFGAQKIVLDDLLCENVVDSVTIALQKYPESAQVQHLGITLLSMMGTAFGVVGSGFTKESYLVIAAALAAFPNIGDLASEFKNLMGLFSVAASDHTGVLEFKLNEMLVRLDATKDIEPYFDPESGRHYYALPDGSTTWDAPASFLELISVVDNLAAYIQENISHVGTTDPNLLKAMVSELDRGFALHSLGFLETMRLLATDDDNCQVLADAGAIDAFIDMAQRDDLDEDCLVAIIEILVEFSNREHLRSRVLELDGFNLIVSILLKYYRSQRITEACLKALPVLLKECRQELNISSECYTAISRVLDHWGKIVNVLKLLFTFVNYLMTRKKTAIPRVGSACTKMLVSTLKNHLGEKALLGLGVKCFGHLSQSDMNICLMVGYEVVAVIVSGVKQYGNDMQLIQNAFDAIGNFSSFESNSVEGRNREKEIALGIILQGGSKFIINEVFASFDGERAKEGLETIENLTLSINMIDRLLKEDIVEAVLEVMIKFDLQYDLLSSALRLIATLTQSKACFPLILENRGVQVIIDSMLAFEQTLNDKVNAVIALKNIALKEQIRDEIYRFEGIDVCLSTLQQLIDCPPLVMEICNLLMRLAYNSEISIAIANKGMPAIMAAIHTHKENVEIIAKVITLIGHLAFTKENLQVITQYAGIDYIIDSMLRYPDNRSLVITCIKTLDNIAMNGREQSDIVAACGGEKTITEFMLAYSSDKGVASVCKAALLGMKRQEPIKILPRLYVTDEGQNLSSNVDPLRDHRERLKHGVLVNMWERTGPVRRLLRCNEDFNFFSIYDFKKRSSGAAKLKFTVGKIISIDTKQIFVYKNKSSALDRSFRITLHLSDKTLDFETETIAECRNWVSAINVLIDTWRYNPEAIFFK